MTNASGVEVQFKPTSVTYVIEYMPFFEPPSLWIRKSLGGWRGQGGMPLPRNWGYIII